ncbi:VanW family protein [Oerskovia enterophila]|uniref:VanW like protein n=1 Tax=Oerskovia enterophila TaxID=43678 RepID=A0A163SEI6_9CELL|nr:VanW family protein [Oerskovia enterophila]KZM36329.1 VanW like protein [Oerskovia enterophila]
MGHPTERENAPEPSLSDGTATPVESGAPVAESAAAPAGVPGAAGAPASPASEASATVSDTVTPEAETAASGPEIVEPADEPAPVESSTSSEPTVLVDQAASAADTPSPDEQPAEVLGAEGTAEAVADAPPVVSDADPVLPTAPQPVAPAAAAAPAGETPEPIGTTTPEPAAPVSEAQAVTPAAPAPIEPAPAAAAPTVSASAAEQAVAPESTATASAAPRGPSFDDDDDVPYSPRVFAFDQSDAATEAVATEAPTGAVTEVLPPVETAPAPAAAAPVASAEPTAPAAAASEAAAVDPAPAAPAPDVQATQVIAPVQDVPEVPATPVEAPAASEVPASPFAPATSAWTSAATSGPAVPPAPSAPARTSVTSAFTPVGASAPANVEPPADDSPLAGLSGDKAPSRLPKVALWAGIGVVVLGGLYTGAQWFYSDKVPPETTVAGVEVGGLDRTSAVAALEKGLSGRAKEPITLQAGEATTTLDPAAAGLAFDAQATADELTSFSMSPVQLWKQLFGGEDEPPVTTVDKTKLAAQVAEIEAGLNLEPVDGSVVFTDGQPTATPAQDGAEVVADEATTIIESSWLTAAQPLELPTDPIAPAITQAETDAALAQATTLVSAPVTVEVGGQRAELSPAVLAEAAAFNAADGSLQLTFDGATLLEAVVDGTDNLLNEAADAKFVFVNGAPVIEGGAPGTTIDPAALSAAVATAGAGTERTATVELVESDPAQSVAALEALGVKEKISEFSTPLTNDAQRTENLRVGASKVNGTLVLPGATFSLTETLSPITKAGGYFSAGIVQDGKHVDGIGGGLSQMATTTYNAGFFAGLDDVEHRQHSYWFTRYPAGREATIFVGSIDMKFKNDTPYGVLMQSWVAGGELHVAIWSTKYYEVQTSEGEKRNVVQPSTVTHSGADCVPQPKGNPGFTITTPRKVLLDGKVVKDEKNTWTYKPDNQVVCAP